MCVCGGCVGGRGSWTGTTETRSKEKVSLTCSLPTIATRDAGVALALFLLARSSCRLLLLLCLEKITRGFVLVILIAFCTVNQTGGGCVDLPKAAGG